MLRRESIARTLRSILPVLTLSGAMAVGACAWAQDAVPVDMASGWVRRDWDECRGRTRLVLENKIITIASDTSAALFWQIPTRSGRPMDIDMGQRWVRECDPPPSGFGEEIQKRDREGDRLLSVSDYRYVTWRWRIDRTIDDRETVDSEGKIQKAGDDFAAKIGISILRKGSDNLREIAYVWTRALPEESVLIQERRILFWNYKWHRIVAESGAENAGAWVGEIRDLYADYKRIYPDEEPGRIVRIYLMADSDNTGDRVTGSFAGIEFHRRKPD